MRRAAYRAVALAACGVVWACATGQARAVSSASATLGPLAIDLIDLDGGDGITPRVVFGGPSLGGSDSVGASGLRTDTSESSSQTIIGTSPWSTASVTANGSLWQSAAQITGSGSAADTSFAASGNTVDFSVSLPYTPLTQYLSTAQISTAQNGVRFVLTPHSEIVVSAFGSIHAAGTGTTDPLDHVFDIADYADAGVSLSFYGATGSPGVMQYVQDVLSYASISTFGVPFDYAASRAMSVTFVNTTDRVLPGWFDVYVSAYGYTTASPVPEPATFALLLAGLTCLATRAKRQFAAQEKNELRPGHAASR